MKYKWLDAGATLKICEKALRVCDINRRDDLDWLFGLSSKEGGEISGQEPWRLLSTFHEIGRLFYAGARDPDDESKRLLSTAEITLIDKQIENLEAAGVKLQRREET